MKYGESNQHFFNLHNQNSFVKTRTIALFFCFFYFFLPLQCFVIGNDLGAGIQGAVFRYQTTTSGISLIPITTELAYVTSGVYEGRTAMSVIFWVLGTSILTILTMLSLVYWDRVTHHQFQFIILGAAGAGICYLASCGFQYGVFLSGPAGKSLPIGVILLVISSIFMYFHRDVFQFLDKKTE